MDMPATRILLVTNEENYYLAVHQRFSGITSQQYALHWVKTVAAAREIIKRCQSDLCLVDYHIGDLGPINGTALSLIDAQIADGLPYILILGAEDAEVELATVTSSYAEFLFEDQLNGPHLDRAIRSALERARRDAMIEATLRQSRLLSTVVDHLSDGMLVTDPSQQDNPIVYANPAFCAMTGYTSGETLGRNCRFLQGTGTDPKSIQQIRAAIDEQRPFKGVIRNYRKDGSPFWNGLKITPVFDDRNQLVNFMGLLADITERRQAEIALQNSEANLTKAQEIARLGSWELDLSNSGQINSGALRWSTQTFRLLGYEPGQIEVTNENFLRAVHPDDRDRVETALSQALSGGPRYDLEYRVVWPDSSQHIIHAQADLVLNPESGIPLKMVGTGQDITDRKQAQQEQYENEQKLLSIYHAVADILFYLKVEAPNQYRFLSVNRSFTTTTGLDYDQIVGKLVTQVIPQPSLTIVLEKYREAIQKKIIVRWEEVSSYPTGQLIGEVAIAPVFDKAGICTHLVGSVHDLTQRKQVEADLRFQRALLEAQSELSLDGILVVGGKSEGRKIHFYNQRLLQMWGISADVMAGGNIDTFREAIWPQIVNAEEATAKTNYIHEHPLEKVFHEISLHNGHTYECYSTPFAPSQDTNKTRANDVGTNEVGRNEIGNNENYGLTERNPHNDETTYGRVWYFRDITSIKQSQEALLRANDELESSVKARTRQLSLNNETLRMEIHERKQAQREVQSLHKELQRFLDAMSTLAVRLSPQGTFLLANQIAIDASGLTREQYMKTNFLEGPWWSFDPAVQERVSLAFRRALSGQVINYDEDIFAFGQVRTINFSLTPIRDAEGKVDHLIAEGRDITDLKNTQEALQQAKVEAERANAAKSQFLSRMSHELRTPLNAILGFGQLLEQEALRPIQLEGIEHILQSGRHLLDLINEVLDISRVENGGAELNIEPLPLEEVIEETCAMVRLLAEQYHVRLHSHLEFPEKSDLPDHFHVMADEQRLRQVLLNLLSNAIKYNKPGGEVKVSAKLAQNDRIQIRVQDTGFGLSPQDLQKLFIPFERLDAAKRHVEGTGLGLVITQQLVNAMGGEMGVESTLGRGSDFWFELPQAPFAAKEAGEISTTPSAPAPLQSLLEEPLPCTVLSIEDNPSNVRLIEVILLSRPHIKLLTALEGMSGLALARQHTPNLILLDLNLPGISGTDVLRELQQSPYTREIPIVVISADASARHAMKLRESGARYYLSKPINVSELLRVLDEILGANP